MKNATRLVALVGAAALGLFAGAAAAQQVQYIYGNSASGGAGSMYQIDINTGTVVKTCPHARGNGRGIVVVGNTVYFTTANSGNVYRMDWPTCADQGVAFTVGAVSGIATIAFDGTDFWLNEYNSPGNRAFKYSIGGTLLTTITLPNCTSNCDGVEFFNGRLISNRGDALNPSHYDVYSLTGALLQPALLGPLAFSGTGIAFDGTNFYVSNIFQQRIEVYNATSGAFVRTITVTGMVAGANVIEDLSVDYNIVIPPAPPAANVPIPTMSEWAMLLMAALLALSALHYLRRR